MINKLVEKIKKTNAPIVVGLDPMLSYVPEHIQKAAFAQFGETLEGAAEAIWQYNKAIVDATYDLIPAVKPQIAMYEQFGGRCSGIPEDGRLLSRERSGCDRRCKAWGYRFHIRSLCDRTSRKSTDRKQNIYRF